MAEAKKAVDVPTGKAEPYGPGDPVEHSAVTQMGATFAERSGKKPPKGAAVANSTFADRKAVSGTAAENKSVSSSRKK
jgi:hypothetical protein